MNVLIIGSGGREHALAWKIKQSPLLTKLYCAPGNGGIAQVAQCVDIETTDIHGLISFAKEKRIHLTIVGPEAPLVAGIVDAFEKEKLTIFGPSKKAAQLEGSKVFSKEFMQRSNIPTAAFKIFDNPDKAKKFLEKAEFPLVIKADGLAAGKGVVVCQKIDEAKKAIDEIMQDKIFKEAGNQIVIEECLFGDEVSILAISDGDDYLLFDACQDHKRIFDDDLGPNTGGMGAYSPVPLVDEELLKRVETRIIDPVIRGMRREGNPFRGILYVGLMITKEGPYVLEFNVRFGDPEAQVVLPRVENDLLEVITAACEYRLHEVDLKWDRRPCVCVVMSSGGYPGKYATGFEITGIESATKDPDIKVFHSGTKKEGDKIVTSGGRVLGVIAMGEKFEKVIERVYVAVEKIKFDRCFFRRDIGVKVLRWLNNKRPKASTHR